MNKETLVHDGRDMVLRDHYRDVIAELTREIFALVQNLKAGTTADASGLAKLLRDLDGSRSILMKIEAKLSDETIQCTGNAGVPDIDFDTMRHSIGRRLDRIRAAQAAG